MAHVNSVLVHERILTDVTADVSSEMWGKVSCVRLD